MVFTNMMNSPDDLVTCSAIKEPTPQRPHQEANQVPLSVQAGLR